MSAATSFETLPLRAPVQKKSADQLSALQIIWDSCDSGYWSTMVSLYTGDLAVSDLGFVPMLLYL
jgi:hypothetical protein